MATYRDIQEHTRRTRLFTPKPCWIAHILSDYGLTTRQAYNRYHPDKREHPCPPHRRRELEAAMREVGALPI
ncbi:hypothetical protein BSQ44_16925 [Aquibium oceanicum]|uniref:Uncharacterized protein n=1 Tax=Aquibium oceanicum TaxID=1670800 RepID=A0A1L3STV0_9HYPH|nr:hypothetical protein BSQ44_16925 [Aquibium oceanicum]